MHRVTADFSLEIFFHKYGNTGNAIDLNFMRDVKCYRNSSIMFIIAFIGEHGSK